MQTVTVDGEAIRFERTDDTIRFSVEAPAGASGVVDIEYETTTDSSVVDVSRKGVRVAALRRLSDCRDIYMVKTRLGRGLVYAYYGTGAHKLGPMRLALIGLAGATCAVFMMAVLVRHVRRRRRKHSLAGDEESCETNRG